MTLTVTLHMSPHFGLIYGHEKVSEKAKYFTTLFCLLSVGYHLELRIAITCN